MAPCRRSRPTRRPRSGRPARSPDRTSGRGRGRRLGRRSAGGRRLRGPRRGSARLGRCRRRRRRVLAAAARREQRAEARCARERDEPAPTELAVRDPSMYPLRLGTAHEPPRPPVPACLGGGPAAAASSVPRRRSITKLCSAAQCSVTRSPTPTGRRPTSSFRRWTTSRSPVRSSTMYCVIEPR